MSSLDLKSENIIFSIVMPVYGVEAYLDKAIEAILNQTFQNFELILVDDCSPDGCGHICDIYAAKDERVRVRHLERNGGLSNARNRGFEWSRGKYVWFPDSDDYYDLDVLERVYKSLEKNPVDLVVFGLQEDYYDEKGILSYSKRIRMDEHLIEKQDEVRKAVIELEAKTLYGYAWNKFYKSDRIRKQRLKFEKVTLIEDVVFNVKYCEDISTMNILDMTPYHYNKRIDNSLTSKFVPEYFKLHRHRVRIIYEQYLAWGMCDLRVKQVLSGIYLRYIMSALERNCHGTSNMSVASRKRWVEALCEDRLFANLSLYFKPNNNVNRITGWIIYGKHKVLCLALGRAIYFVKNKMPMVFARVKQKR